jgi:hypothetical protein
MIIGTGVAQKEEDHYTFQFFFEKLILKLKSHSR